MFPRGYFMWHWLKKKKKKKFKVGQSYLFML